MISADRLISKIRRANAPGAGLLPRGARHSGLLLALGPARGALGSENVPELPFAEWADVPAAGQFILGAVYEQSKSYQIWASGVQDDSKVRSGVYNYGINIRQGYFALQYGITERWAADLEVGGTTVGWRAFSPGNEIESTTGLMDISFGVRYQLFNEAEYTNSSWVPTVTFRAGAVLPGSYNQDFVFAPGFRSAAIEPELLLRKHFGWPGLGVYADGLYRWNRTTGNDQYITVIGLFQQ